MNDKLGKLEQEKLEYQEYFSSVYISSSKS